MKSSAESKVSMILSYGGYRFVYVDSIWIASALLVTVQFLWILYKHEVFLESHSSKPVRLLEDTIHYLCLSLFTSTSIATGALDIYFNWRSRSLKCAALRGIMFLVSVVVIIALIASWYVNVLCSKGDTWELM